MLYANRREKILRIHRVHVICYAVPSKRTARSDDVNKLEEQHKKNIYARLNSCTCHIFLCKRWICLLLIFLMIFPAICMGVRVWFAHTSAYRCCRFYYSNILAEKKEASICDFDIFNQFFFVWMPQKSLIPRYSLSLHTLRQFARKKTCGEYIVWMCLCVHF